MSKPTAAFTHAWIWQAIDTLASRRGLTPSALARLAGLDPTTFNRSKRVTPEGRPRWPSTESIAKVLEATGTSLDEFAALDFDQPATSKSNTTSEELSNVPLVGEVRDAAIDGLAKTSLIDLHKRRPSRAGSDLAGSRFALAVADSSLEPAYSQGNTLIASIAEIAHSGDRVVVQPLRGQAIPGLLVRSTRSIIELAAFRPSRDIFELPRTEVRWIARIIWARQ
ncbi:MAG: helix-turn-helix transcriptional regulator [Hyphomicrobiaceae bacterium]